MVPILYEKDEVSFTNNGLGRLRDVISCTVFEERNGIYECNFEIAVDSEDFPLIQIGRIVGVTHDDTGDIQPFDIVSYDKPIDGVVTFHCTHISYRQSYLTVNGTGINSLSDAFTRLRNNATPSNPFNYWTDMTRSGYCSAISMIPQTVRAVLGGVEGSILDTYGGEYEWDQFTVKLWESRGQLRDFTIRYGVNMIDYQEQFDLQGTYSSCIPYWTDGTNTIVGDKQTASGSTVTGRGECVPLDVSDKFEDQPTKAQVNSAGLSIMNSNRSYLPTQNIHVEFLRLQDMSEYAGFENLYSCALCDTINVAFPPYGSSGQFKIVKTIWDVLSDRYESMELGDLSITLSEALGVDNGGGGSSSGVDIKALLNTFYPVGSYYETSDTSFNPNTAWGGTWVEDTAGRVTVARNASETEFDSVGEIGGSKYIQNHAHAFTQPSIPNHSHDMKHTHPMPHTHTALAFRNIAASGSARRVPYGYNTDTKDGDLTTSGSSAPNTSAASASNTGTTPSATGCSGGSVNGVQTTSHTAMTTGGSGNLQPYIVVKRWHRTA